MSACNYLKQRVRRIREQNGKYFKDVSKQKRHKEINTVWLSLIITQFKIEFILPLPSCRKVLEKMPEMFKLSGMKVQACLAFCKIANKDHMLQHSK